MIETDDALKRAAGIKEMRPFRAMVLKNQTGKVAPMPLGNTEEGFATIPVTLHWQESDKLNRSQAAIFDAVLNHDKSSHSAIRGRNRFQQFVVFGS